MAQLHQESVRVQEFSFIEAVVGINLQVKVRRIPLDAGVAHIGDEFAFLNGFTLHDALGVSLQVHIPITSAVLTPQQQANAGLIPSR